MAETNSEVLEQRKQDLVNAKLSGDAKEEMIAYEKLGQAYGELSDFNQAVNNFMYSLGIARQNHDRAYEGEVSCSLGNAYYKVLDYKQAIEHYNKLLIISSELSDRVKEKYANQQLGHCHKNLVDNKQAVAHYNKFDIISKEQGDRDGERHANHELGSSYQALGDYKQAIDCYNKFLIISKELCSRPEEKQCANHRLGQCHQNLADNKEAMAHFNKFLTISKELGDTHGEIDGNCHLGKCYGDLGDYKQAIEHYSKTLIISKELGGRVVKGTVNLELGICCEALGDYKQAIEHCNKHHTISKELGDRNGERHASHELGKCYVALGDCKQAFEHFNRDLVISEELGDRYGEGHANLVLGQCFRTIHDYKQALEYLKESLIIAKKTGNKAEEGKAKHSLGHLYDDVDDNKEAAEYFLQWLDIVKDAGDRDDELQAYYDLGSVYLKLGKFSTAKEYFDKELVLAKEFKDKDAEGKSYIGLGRAHMERGDFMEAIEYFSQFCKVTKEVDRDWGQGCGYHLLAEAYGELNNFKEATHCCMKSLAFAKKTGIKNHEERANYLLGHTMEKFNFLHEAVDHYRSTIRLFNDKRNIIRAEDDHKICIRNARQGTYDSLCRTLLKLSNFGEALCVADQGRAQVLLDHMKQQYQMEFPLPRTSEPDIARLVSAQTIFIALEDEKINIWLVSNGDDVKFRQKEAKHDYRFGNDPCPCCLKCLKTAAFKENEFAARVICEDRSLEAIRLDLSQQDEELLSEDCILLDDLPRDESLRDKESCHKMTQRKSNSLHLLYDNVIGPIANKLKGDELVIVPDGPLCQVPFAAFVDEDSKYLSESFKIRIAPSLTSLRLIKDCPEDYHCKSGALLVGNPSVEEITDLLGKPWFQPLSHAEKEVQMIGEIINATPLVGKDATKDEVLKRIASVALVHVAAHGSAETGEICLAPNPSRKNKKPEKEDYMLKMSDIQALKIRARLVVLSCCHSGRGKVSAEGVVGMAWALLGSGARSVLASLWAIGDEATKEFMKAFYQHLRDGDTASAAINKAMKCLRESEKFSAPKNWAPFVIIGDDVTLDFREREDEHYE